MNNLTKKLSTLILALLIISAVASFNAVAPVTAQATSSDWPQFMADPQHTGYSPGTSPDHMIIDWTYKTGGPVYSSAAVVNNKLYIGCEDRFLYCLDANTGALLWKFEAGRSIGSSPAVVDGKVYFGSVDHYVYCLNADSGSLIWKFQTNGMVWSSPTLINGKVYINSMDKNTYCLNASTGASIWNFTNRGITNSAQLGVANLSAGSAYYSSSPAIAGDWCYVASFDRYVYGLNATTGVKIWDFKQNATTWDSSPMYSDGRVFVGSDSYDYIALNATTGVKIWTTNMRQVLGAGVFWIQSTAAAAYGKVYMAAYHTIAFYDPAYKPANPLNCTQDPIIAPWFGTMQKASATVCGGKVFTGNHDRRFYMLDANTGAMKQSFQLRAGIDSTAAHANGKIYIGCLDGLIYCFKQGEGSEVGSMGCNVNVNPRSIMLGETAPVTAYVGTFNGEWPVGADIGLNYTKPDGTVVTRTVITDGLGQATDNYVPDAVGKWTVMAIWAGNDVYEPATSFTQSFTVTEATSKTSTTISVSAVDTSVAYGNVVKVHGGTQPGASGVITLTYTKPDGSTLTHTTNSIADGTFFDTMAPDSVGTWTVSAAWTGNNVYQGATSSDSTFAVQSSSQVTNAPIDTISYALIAGIIVVLVILAALIFAMRKQKV